MFDGGIDRNVGCRLRRRQVRLFRIRQRDEEITATLTSDIPFGKPVPDLIRLPALATKGNHWDNTL